MKNLYNMTVPVPKKPGIDIGGLPSESLRTSTRTMNDVKVEEVVSIPAVFEITEDVVIETITEIEEEVVVETIPAVKKPRKPRVKKADEEK